jgi:hypothetical protein
MINAKLQSPTDAGVVVRTLLGFALSVLMVLGVAGTVWKLLTPGGWLAQLFGRSVAGGMGAILTFLAIVLCFRLSLSWISLDSRNRFAELPVYAFAGVGSIYALQMLMAR